MRRLLCLRPDVAMYAARLECGVAPLFHATLRQAMKFRCKLIQMDDDRYPKICFNQLLALHRQEPEKGNWVTQFTTAIQAGMRDATALPIWESEDPSHLYRCIEGWMDLLYLNARASDIDKVKLSDTYRHYESYIPKEIKTPAEYLRLPITFFQMRIIAQSRLNRGHFSVNKGHVHLNKDAPCTYCCYNANSTLHHLLHECALTAHHRDIYRIDADIRTFLNPRTKEQATAHASFIIHCLFTVQEIQFFDQV